MIPYNPLAGGLLTGKHDARGAARRGHALHSWAVPGQYQERYWHDREFDDRRGTRRSPTRPGITMATLAVGWVLANPAITSPIIGASRPEQLADSLAAAEIM